MFPDVALKDFENTKYRRCHILEDNMAPELKSLFSEVLREEEMQDYIQTSLKDWFDSKKEVYQKDFSVDLITLLYYSMDELLLEFGEDARKAYACFAKTKRNRKDYIMQSIKEEYLGAPKPQNPMFMEQQASSFFNAAKVDPSLKSIYHDKESYIDFIYNEILNWKKSAESLLTAFYFYPMLSHKRKLDLLVIDLSIYMLRYIIDKNTGNFDIGLLSFPTTLTDGVFSFKNNSYDTEIIFEDNKIVNAISYSYQDEDGHTVLNKTVLEEIEGDYSNYTDKAKSELLASLKEKGKLEDHIRDLSNLEFNVLAHVYSNFTSTLLTEDRLRFPGKEFCKQILNSNRLRDRDAQKVMKALEKLASVRIETEKRDFTGALHSKSIYSFFDLSYGTDTEEASFTKSTIITQTLGEDNIDSSLPNIDLMGDDWYIDIAPSVYLKDTWRENKDTYIYSKLYKLVSDKVSEVLTIMFQQLRIQNMDTLQADVSYTFLRNRLKANGVKLSMFKKELEKDLIILKNSNVIIRDFVFNKNAIHVDFLDISAMEKIVYGIDAPSSIQGISF